MKRITKLSVSIFCLLIFSQLILSQTTRKQLESQKAAIQKELKQINELLFKNKKQKAETFSDIEKLSLKIERKQEFIKLTNKQINLLNKDLQENQKKQDQLSIELSQVRSAYKELILQSAKKMLYYGMKEFTHDNYGFSTVEIQKLKRTYDYAISADDFDVETNRKDFVKFVDQYDKRRKLNFLDTFPQLKEFYVKNQ